MILKEKTLIKAKSPTSIAGQKQEKDVAFFLSRAFKDHENIYIINDYKINFNDEVAQIDHLILYPYGFILIESKSIKGEVKANALGEWTRSIGNKWIGITSPIKQVELQENLLKDMLASNKDKILGKLLGMQKGFSKRCWDSVCAVSSSAIIDRESMPSSVSNKLVKTEFLTDKIKEVMNIKDHGVFNVNPFDPRPAFSEKEMKSIASFLMSQLSKKTKNNESNSNIDNLNSTQLQCKSCNESSDYSAQYGKFGYFIKCNKCQTNTSMKLPCGSCNSKNTKVSKSKDSYSLKCNDCDSTFQLI